MEKIRFISTNYVKPENKTDHRFSKLELTPWDVTFLLIDTIQKGLLFRKPADHSKQDINELIEHLKASFSSALDIFYPLSGRLAVSGNSFFLDCNAAGAEFVHAEALDGVTVADILDAVYVPDDVVYSLFLMNGVLNYEGKSRPLLAVQVTELVDGIFIGMTMNHCVGDGKGFWSFFNTWSEIARSGTSTIPRPVFGREFLDGIINLPIRFPSFQDPVLENEIKLIPSEESLMQRMFHFRKEKIAELKSEANEQMGTRSISSLQAVMGHLWISITRARRSISSHTISEEEASQEITTYVVLVGMRQRLHDLLSDEYTSNALLLGIATTSVGQLLKGGLGCAAMELNKAIASQTEKEARKFLKDYVENPSLLKKGADGKRYWLATGSSPRFDVYGNDFGWGKPVAVRSGIGNKTDGKLTVFAGAEEGSIDFEACLSAQTLRALAEDEEFMQSLVVL